MASFVPKDRTKLAAILGALTFPVVELPLSDFESQANDSSAWQAQAQLSDIFKVRHGRKWGKLQNARTTCHSSQGTKLLRYVRPNDEAQSDTD